MGKNVEGTNLTDTDRKVSIIVDKCGAWDQTSRKGHKHRMPDKEMQLPGQARRVK